MSGPPIDASIGQVVLWIVLPGSAAEVKEAPTGLAQKADRKVETAVMTSKGMRTQWKDEPKDLSPELSCPLAPHLLSGLDHLDVL